jgi:hypothetical protein
MKKKTTMVVDKWVERLREEGYRVRDGGWPETTADERNWDFCRVKDYLVTISDRATQYKFQRVSLR